MRRTLCAVGLVALFLTWTAPTGAQVPDHLKCYKVKDPQPKAKYTADLGGLVAEPGCTIKVPAVLACVPATKTHDTPTPPGTGGTGTPNSFGCYKIKCPKATLPTLALNDQFGSRVVTPKTANLLCAPATGSTTTTSTSTSTTAPPTTTTITSGSTTTSTTLCPSGQTLCNGTCVDTSTDPNNCGACFTICPGSPATCSGGVCICPSPTVMCQPFICTDLSTDTQNCGACGHVCLQNEACSGGLCACAAPNTLCGSQCNVRPCQCVDLQTDPSNCGTCGNVCPVSGDMCSSGVCACPAGESACGSLGAFFCTDTTSDPTNCGTCGTVCSGDTSTCFNSTCCIPSGNVVPFDGCDSSGIAPLCCTGGCSPNPLGIGGFVCN